MKSSLHSSQLLSPEDDLLLLEVPHVLLVDQDQVQEVLHRESIILDVVRWRDVRRYPP